MSDEVKSEKDPYEDLFLFFNYLVSRRHNSSVLMPEPSEITGIPGDGGEGPVFTETMPDKSKKKYYLPKDAGNLLIRILMRSPWIIFVVKKSKDDKLHFPGTLKTNKKEFMNILTSQPKYKSYINDVHIYETAPGKYIIVRHTRVEDTIGNYGKYIISFPMVDSNTIIVPWKYINYNKIVGKIYMRIFDFPVDVPESITFISLAKGWIGLFCGREIEPDRHGEWDIFKF